MIRIFGTAIAALLGLAFGSFLNVCLSRWPAGESIVNPPSHCRTCGRTLRWWENVPLASWLALGGRCRTCRASIGWRYPLVEAAVAGLWALIGFRLFSRLPGPGPTFAVQPANPAYSLLGAIGLMILCWLLVGLAVLDAEHLWLADAATIPGFVLGLAYSLFWKYPPGPMLRPDAWKILGMRLLAALAAASVILLIRWIYWLIRRREGIGLGDAKLMALLAAWLGLPGALLAFALGVALGAVAAVVLLALPAARASGQSWALKKLPLGTFLCLGGIVSALWGAPILSAYLRWAGF
jgi:leader peptidase (prepilin peptidase) / N-methyltransferase